ncbi:MAG: RagB/SusD family nutrient uptake outer membrane protein [Bacteroidota bacterium]
MKKILCFTAAFILGMILTSCSESLLDIEHRGVITETNYFKTDKEAISSIATLYKLWKQELYSSVPLFDHMTPDWYAGGGIRNDNVQYEAENEFRYTTEDTNISNYFKLLYTIIYNSNLILESYSDDSETKLRVKAEAKFFRAYANFMLVTLWETPYYVDHVLIANEYQMPNAESTSVFWASIESDLNDAINSGKLPSKSGQDDFIGRLTKECAQAYLGKIYLWQEKYSEAAAELQKVIDSGKYGLVDDLILLFHSAGDHCKEYLAEAESLNDPVNWSSQGGISGMSFAWKLSNSIVLHQNTDIWPYQSTGGYGFGNPTLSFVNLVESVEGVNGNRFKNYFISWDELVNTYGATATRNHFFNEGWFQTKLLAMKGDNFASSSAFGWFFTHQNWPHMRYAEVLLMASEAYLESGNMTNAVSYFNMIRERAAAPTVLTLDIETILQERRIELWGESPVIFQDIQRYRLGEELCTSQYSKYPVYTLIGEYATNPQIIWYDNTFEYGFKEKHYLLPYSSSELRSNSKLIQNPGW